MSKDKPSFDKAPELEPELEAAVWSIIQDPIDADAVDRVKARAKSLSHEQPSDVTLRTAPPRGFPVSRILQALAASVVFAIGGWLWLSSSSSAFAQVMERIREAQSLTYVTLLEIEAADEPIKQRVMVAADGRSRRESDNNIFIYSESGELRLTLNVTLKTAFTMTSQELPTTQFSEIDWIESLRKHTGKPEKELGRRIIEGRELEGYVVRAGIHAYTIWIDPANDSLARIEHDPHIEGMGIDKTVMKDFQFDVPLDDSLFSTKVPEGYTARDVGEWLPKAGVPEPSEESLLEALRGFTNRSNGKFPSSLTDWNEWSELVTGDDQGSEEGKMLIARLGGLIPFLSAKSKDDYEYLGAGKTTDQERCIVFWHRLESGTIRAIFNDLKIAEITENDLP